ncbi:MAG: CbtB domain-containing protein [Rhizobiaceae bacterium]
MLTTNTNTLNISLSASQRFTTALVSFVLGSGLLYGVAFSQPEILHNAAHDTRHAIVAPCH